MLNNFELVLVQEDFFYHNELLGTAEHPFRSDSYTGWSIVGDGLTQLSVFPFSPVRREVDCQYEQEDRFLFRSGRNVRLDVLDWFVSPAFVDAQDRALSDHSPVGVRYLWRVNKPVPAAISRRSAIATRSAY